MLVGLLGALVCAVFGAAGPQAEDDDAYCDDGRVDLNDPTNIAGNALRSEWEDEAQHQGHHQKHDRDND